MAKVNVQKLFNTLFQGLSPRQREVLAGRFALEGKGKAETLAALGERYGVTRERIRQIEAGAIDVFGKKAKVNHGCAAILARSRRILKNAGGVMRENDLLAENEKTVDGLRSGHLQLLVEATGDFCFRPADDSFWPFYYLDRKNAEVASDFLSRFVKALRSRKEEALSGKFEAHLASVAREERVSPKFAKTFLTISKKIHQNPYGDTGLVEWPEIRPKTIRDRIYLVLKKNAKPVHFREIATLINHVGFSGREALSATVHNELIKDNRFVLVGRGIYGLAEHGYRVGTAKEVIRGILKSEGPLSFKDLVSAVQRDRIFKPNTILANLQDKAAFKRFDDGKYHVREA